MAEPNLIDKEVRLTIGEISEGVVKRQKIENGYWKYLIEYGDGERKWYDGIWVQPSLPTPNPFGNIELFEDLEVYEGPEWTTVKVDGDIVYDNDNLDGIEMLRVLDIRHKYLYTDDVDLFRLVAEGTYA